MQRLLVSVIAVHFRLRAVVGDGVDHIRAIRGAPDRRQGTVAVFQHIVDPDSRIEQIIQPVERLVRVGGVSAVDIERELIRHIGKRIPIVFPIVLHINIVDGRRRILRIRFLISETVARQRSVLIERDFVNLRMLRRR